MEPVTEEELVTVEGGVLGWVLGGIGVLVAAGALGVFALRVAFTRAVSGP